MDRYRTHETVNQLLKAVGVGVVVSAGLIAPNSLQIVDKHLQKKQKDHLSFEQKRLFRHMKRLNLLSIDELADGNVYVSLTSKGKKRLQKVNLSEVKVDTSSWDGRWRFITFDIKQELQKIRIEFLGYIRALGFIQVQQNMWAYPFHCEKEIIEIADALGITKNILFLDSKLTKDRHEALIKNFSLLLSKSKLKA